MLRSMARFGCTVAFRKKDEMCLYKIEKSDCEMCTDPRTVRRYAGEPCSLASFMRDCTASKLDCQYMKASELIPRMGKCIRCLGSSAGGLIGALLLNMLAYAKMELAKKNNVAYPQMS
jgi:hypothetical protein